MGFRHDANKGAQSNMQFTRVVEKLIYHRMLTGFIDLNPC